MIDAQSDPDYLSSSLASSFSYAQLTEEEKQRILNGHAIGDDKLAK